MNRRSTSTLNNDAIVLYALFLLGGWQKRVHLEDVAIKCFQIAPTKFSWIKYPQYPDLAPARFALEKVKKNKNGNLVEGESEKKKSSKTIGGWMLTANGVKWMDMNKSRIEIILGKHIPSGSRLASDRKLRALQQSVAFKKYILDPTNANISHAELAESLLCTVNTTDEVIFDRINQLHSVAEKLKLTKINEYLTFCKEKFKNILVLSR